MVAPVFLDRIKEATLTTGTGAITLNGAVPSHRPVSLIGNGKTFHYLMYNDNDFETGIGTYNSGSNTFSRDQIYSSSNSNNAVAWSVGVKYVVLTVPSRLLTALSRVHRTVTANTTLDDTAGLVLCNNSSDITLTLPPAANMVSCPITFKKIGANTAKVTLDGNASETIDGALTTDLFIVNDLLELTPVDGNWQITQNNLKPHRAKIQRTTAQSIPVTTLTRISFNVASVDSCALFSSADFGVKIRRAGQYNVLGSIGWTGFSNSDVIITHLRVNGVTIQEQVVNASSDTSLNSCNLSELLDLAVNDIVTMWVQQTTAGAINTNTTTALLPRVSAEEVLRAG